MPTVGQVAGTAAPFASVGLKLLGLSNPYTAAISGALSLVQLVDKIGQGRKAANKFTQNGGPQDIINKQLAAISSSNASAQEKAQATQKAWTDFLGAANDFAAKNPKQSTVVKQAIYQTPDLTNTVKSLMGGQDPLDAKFTDIAAQGIATGNKQPNPGPSVAGTLLKTGLSVGLPFAINKLQGGVTVGNVGGSPDGTPLSGTPQWNPETGQWETPSGFDPSNPGTWVWGGDPTSPNIKTDTGGGLGGILSGILGGGGNSGNGSTGGSLLQRLLPQLISSGTALFGAKLGADAANKAATTQSDAALEAARLQAQAGKDALQFQRDALAQQQQNSQPWLDAGANALKKIGDIPAFQAPTADEAMQDPGIQFQLQQGQRALEAYQRGRGVSLSGKAVKEINQYAQGVASQGYQNVFNRDLAAREANLNPLLSVAGLGQVSTQGANANLGTAAGNNANITMTTAGNVGNQSTNAAAARASGYVGGANAWGGALSQIGNNALDSLTIRQLMQRLGGWYA